MREVVRLSDDDLRSIRPLCRFVPLASFLVVGTLSVALHHQVAGSVGRIEPPLVELSGIAASANLASAATLWAGATYAGFLAMLVTLSLSIATIIQLGGEPIDPDARAKTRRAMRTWLAIIAAVALIAGFVEFALNDSPPILRLDDRVPGAFLAIPAPTMISFGNAAMMTTIASIFGASALLIARAQVAETDDVSARPSVFAGLRRRLAVVFGLGAVSTVAGVVNVIALHRMPGALLGDDVAFEAARVALDGYAMNIASFWGIVFTTGLALVHLPTAWILSQECTSACSSSGAVDESGDTSWFGAGMQPFARLLTGLSPFLVGLLGQLLSGLGQATTPG